MATMTRMKIKKLAIEVGDEIALAYKLEPYDPKRSKEDLRPVFTVVPPPGDPSCVGTVRRALLGQVTVDVVRTWSETVEPRDVRVCPKCGTENPPDATVCGLAPSCDFDGDFAEVAVTKTASVVERTEVRQLILPLKVALAGHVKKQPAAEGGGGEGSGEAGSGVETGPYGAEEI